LKEGKEIQKETKITPLIPERGPPRKEKGREKKESGDTK